MDSDERKGDVCGLLGTNVLCHVPAMTMSEALHSMTDAEDTPQDVARIVRVAGCRPIFVPANSTMAIPARRYCRSGTAIVEPLSTAITGNILTLNTLHRPCKLGFVMCINRGKRKNDAGAIWYAAQRLP